MPDIFENADADLTPQMRNLIDLLWREWKMVEQIEVLSLELGGSPPRTPAASHPAGLCD